ncbi:unnamed protein product [Penicillium glandicola]
MSSQHRLIDDEGYYIKSRTIIAVGKETVIVRRGDVAIKIPVIYNHSTPEEVKEHRRFTRLEQEVWKRVQRNFHTPVEGIVQCLGLPGRTIEMKYMSGGTIENWIEQHTPCYQLQLQWFRQLATGLHNLHRRRVLHRDILARNILLDDSLNAEIMDLGASKIMPMDTVMAHAVDSSDCSIWTDLCQLGLVFYEIVTQRQPNIALFYYNSQNVQITRFPSRDMLPVMSRKLWARDIIETCWKKGGFGVSALCQSIGLEASS